MNWIKLLKIGGGLAAAGVAGYGVGQWVNNKRNRSQAENMYDDEYYDEEYVEPDNIVYIKGRPYREDMYGNYIPL